MADDEDRPPGPADQRQAGEEKPARDPDEPRHTVTYSRRRFLFMLGGAAVVGTGFYELLRQFEPQLFSAFPVTSIDGPPQRSVEGLERADHWTCRETDPR